MIIVVALVLVGALFCGAVFFGAPYLPTLKPQIHEALDLLDLKPGQIMIELGSGDGRVLRAAAEKGIHVVGYEINPFLVVVSYFVTLKYRKQVTIVWGNFWRKKLPKSDAVFVFLLTRYMSKLDSKMKDYSYKPIKVASVAFQIPDKKPAQKKGGVFLYMYK